jgi:hypothetical protein
MQAHIYWKYRQKHNCLACHGAGVTFRRHDGLLTLCKCIPTYSWCTTKQIEETVRRRIAKNLTIERWIETGESDAD